MDNGKTDKIIKIIEENNDIQLISFDIFNTLIFRCVDKDIDIFNLVGHKARENLFIPEYISDEEYKNLRIAAQKKAEEKKRNLYGNSETTLEEIYKEMPYSIHALDCLRLEIETEIEYCYPCIPLHELIQKLVAQGRTVILISDMYLSSKQIIEILINAGYKKEWFDSIFVSSEYKVSKQNGELFRVAIDQYKILPGQMLHIGDNYASDIRMASALGIKTFYYDVISGNQNIALEIESLAFHSLVPQVASLRKFASTVPKNISENDIAWYQIGTVVMAPLLIGFAEWIIQIAQESNIQKIFPLMREGKLIANILNIIIKKRNLSIQVKPLYVSRKSLLLPSMKEWNEDALLEIFNIKKITIEGIFNILKIMIPSKLEKYSQYTIKEAKRIQIGSKNLEQMLSEYLLTDKIRIQINKIIEKETKNAWEYLLPLIKEGTFLTADIGYKGTISLFMERLMQKKGILKKGKHMLLFGSDESVETFLENIDIQGFTGNFGRNQKYIKQIRFAPYIFEEMMMCDEGTTVEYKKVKDNMIPVTKKLLSKKQIEKISICQQGIQDFLYEYLKISEKNKKILLGIKDSDDLVKVAFRLLSYPTFFEAKALSSLEYDENMGTDILYPICRQEHLTLLKKIGLEQFNKQVGLYDIYWMPGLIVQADPMYYYKLIIENSSSQYETKIISIVQDIIKDQLNKIVIIGAGEVGQKIKKYLDLYKYIGITIQIEAFSDNNPYLWGTWIDDIEIQSLEHNFTSTNYVIGSFAYTDELLEQLYRIKGNEISVYYRH